MARHPVTLATCLAIAWLACHCAGCVAGSDHPFLYRVEGPRPSYLFGTMHLADRRLLVLHPEVTRAFGQADALYTEIPLGISAQHAAIIKARLPDGRTWRDDLPEALARRTENYLRRRGLSPLSFSDQPVWAVTTTLGPLDYMLEFVLRPPMDQQLWYMAEQQGKQIGSLETVAEQVSVFDSLSQDEQVQWLTQTLDRLEAAHAAGSSPTRDLVEIYLGGNEEEMRSATLAAFGDDPALRDKLQRVLLTERDAGLARRMELLLRARATKSYFFAVGVAHLLGEDGVLDRLRRGGYAVERVNVNRR